MLKNKRFDLILNWKNKKNIPTYLSMLFFTVLFVTYLYQDSSKIIQSIQILIVCSVGFCISLISLLEIKTERTFLQKYKLWIKGFLLFLTPITSFLMVETMVSNYNRDMFENYSIYNLIWYFAIVFLLYILIRNSRSTIIISNFMIYLAATVNYLVYLFRGNPILPSDLLAWQTGVSVASNYELSISWGFLVATLLMLTMFLLALKLDKSTRKISIPNRMVGFSVFTLFALGVFFAFFRTDLISSKIRVLDFFAPKYTYIAYGTAFGFVANVQAMETECPEGYSLDQVKKAYQTTKVERKDILVTEEKPNIIAIMSEAFSDLSRIGDYKTNMDYLPYIRSLEKNTTKGTMYVSVFGGATSDTEYEFLTGNSMAVMPQNCVPYQQFITEPTDSLASTLKNQGYYNIAIHPYEPSGYKRDLVYPLLGFDEFLSMEDFKNPQLIRSFISDRESYRKIIEEYEAKGKENPLFIFNVTMQNHGGYSEDQIFDDNETVRLTELEGYQSVEQYLSLVRESDKAFQTLVDYFTKEEEHTIILLFGDHQPVVFSKFHDELIQETNGTDADAYTRKYMVPFLLWANYDISEDDVDKISANYLSSYLLETAGLEGTPYHTYLSKLQEEVPVINALFYIDKNNECHKFSELTPYSELIKNYRYVGYNNALDKKDKFKMFFKLEETKHE